MDKKDKQKEFMLQYEKIHVSFVKYCKAKSYGLTDYKDLVSESVLRAFNGYENLKNKNVFSAYIFNIASNILKNEIRKKYNEQKFDKHKIHENQTEQNLAVQKLEIEILYNALAKLPLEQKDAIILFEISGYSIKEIAEMKDASISAIKQRLKRGREKLAELLNVPKIKNEQIETKSKILLTLFF